MLREQEEPRPYSLLRKQQPYISADARDAIAKIIGLRFEEDTLTRVKVKKVQVLDLYNQGLDWELVVHADVPKQADLRKQKQALRQGMNPAVPVLS